MGQHTTIAWTDHTFNPWRGCTKVSPGCTFCYAEKLSKRNPKVLGVWGDAGARVVAGKKSWDEVLRWNEKAAEDGVRRKVFCASLSDWLENRPELDWPLARLLFLIERTPHLDWLLLTKRPELFWDRLRAAARCKAESSEEEAGREVAKRWLGLGYGKKLPPNVWMGTSVEDQERADLRVKQLALIPARVRFLSIEPLLGPIRFLPEVHNLHGAIHWSILGGESGGKARPCNLEWVRDIKRQLEDAGVSVFVKQLGANVWDGDHNSPAGSWNLALDDPKGGDMGEWPDDLQGAREFPQ